MRNLKKVLSLALALVMLLGMMVVGAGATEFKDASDIKNTEAVAVVSGIGVLQGDENGSFNPEGTLSRAEAAVVIAKLDLGAAFGNLATTNASTFKDVGAGYGWAKPYIDYCAARGLIAGDGAGHFMPDQKVSGVQFALMVCRVLGYEDANEQIGGDDWAVEAAALARKAGLTVDVVLADPAAISRDDMAQVAFNALQADMVKYDGKGITIGDVTIPAGNAEPKGTGVDDLGDGNTNLQLAEEKFPQLEVDTGDTNEFGRPVNTWSYKNVPVGSFTNTEAVVTYNTNKANDASGVARDLRNYSFNYVDVSDTTAGASGTEKSVKGNSTVELATGDKVSVTANGTTSDTTAGSVGANAAKTISQFVADLTGDGKIVEIYTDDNRVVTKIVTLSYTVDTIASVVESKDGDYRRTTYTGENTSLQARTYTDPDKDDTAILHGDVAEDDVVTYVELDNGETHIYPTEQVVGAQSAKNSKAITVDGTKYNVGLAVFDGTDNVAMADFANSSSNANYFIDVNGFVVATTAVETSVDYAVIDKIALMNATGTAGNKAVEAILVFADGTTKTVNVTKINGVAAKNISDSAAAISKNASNAGTDPNKVTALSISSIVGDNAMLEGALVSYTEDEGNYEISLLNLKSTSLTGATAKATVFDKQATSTSSQNATPTAVTVTSKGNPNILGYGKTDASDATLATNNDTVFIVKTADGDNTKFASYTGFREVPTVKVTGSSSAAATAFVSYATDKNGSVSFVFIDASKAGASAGDTQTGRMLYLSSNAENLVGSGSSAYSEFTAIVDGEEDVVVKTRDSGVITAFTNSANRGKLYELTENADGFITAINEQDQTGASYTDAYRKITLANASQEAKGGVIAGYSYDSDTKVIVIEGHELAGSNINAAKVNDTIYVKVEDKNASDSKAVTLDTIYIVRASAASLANTAITMGTITVAATDTADTHDKPSASATVDATAGTIAVTVNGIWADTETITVPMTLPTNAHASNAGSGIGSLTDTSFVLTRGAANWGTSLTFDVTAADGTTVKTYTVTVTENNQATRINESQSTAAFTTTGGGTGAGTVGAPGTVTVGTDSNTGTIAITKPGGWTLASGDQVVVTLKDASSKTVGTTTMTYDLANTSWSNNTITETTADSAFEIVWTITVS